MNITPRFSRTLALVAPTVALGVSSASAASDYFLKIEGIKGESTDSVHKDWIILESFSWGCTNAGARTGTGAPTPKDLTVSKRLDKSSPQLMLACASGQHFPSVQFTVQGPDGSGAVTDYYVVTLSDVLVSSFQSSGGSGGDRPTESVSFNYQKIEIHYVQVSTGETSSASFDFTAPAGTL